MYRKYIKRLLDIILSITSIIVLSPILIVVAFLVKKKLGSPILFIQKRPGLHGKIFEMYKFRTMTDEKDINGNLLSDSVRLTPFGKKLRSTSLDELPELFNIFKGDMSIVGPRPLLVQYLPLYNAFQARRHEVRPGLTGWAQVNGRNTVSWQERFKLDVEYVQNVCLKKDIEIIGKTILAVIRRDGISSETSQTMEAFTGNEEDHVS